MTLKAELEMNYESGLQIENVMMALNVETKKWWWLWMPKLKNNGGFESRNWEMMVTLNAETEKRWWLWTPELETNDDFEHQTKDMALNVKLKVWCHDSEGWTRNERRLWTPN